MFAKVLTAVIVLVAIGAALLALRQHRLNLEHEMAELHRQMDASRKQVWDRQYRIAEQTAPAALREAIEEAGLRLEPITPVAQSARSPKTDTPTREPDEATLESKRGH